MVSRIGIDKKSNKSKKVIKDTRKENTLSIKTLGKLVHLTNCL